MSNYLSNLLTTTTSRYNSIRRQLLSEETDGDTEDDTNVCRVLRAYYTEKGRPFPPWLPPDPKAKAGQAPVQQFVTSSSMQRNSGGGQTASLRGSGGGLSDLWDSPAQNAPPPQQPQSLRVGRGAGAGRPSPGLRPDSLNAEPAQSRPLPSQRAGSYQSSFSQSSFSAPANPSPPPSSGGATSAQERLKARLWGSGRQSPGATSTASAESAPSPGRTTSPYEQGGSGRFASPPPSGNPYGVQNDNSGGRPGGLPRGPRQGGTGLPSGPRANRWG